RDGSTRLYDLDSGRESDALSRVAEPIAVRFDAAGRRLAIATLVAAEAVRIVDLDSPRNVVGVPLPAGVWGLDWHPNGRTLVAGCADGQIYVVDTADPAGTPRVVRGHQGPVVSLDFDPRGELLVSGSWDGTIRLWDARNWRQLVVIPAASPSVGFSRDGRC